MSQVLNILLQVLFMLGVALLYYLFQRRRIMKQEKVEIEEILNEFIVDHQEYEEAKDYLNSLKEANQQHNYRLLLELSNSPHSKLPKDSQDFLKDMDERLAFLIKNLREK